MPCIAQSRLWMERWFERTGLAMILSLKDVTGYKVYLKTRGRIPGDSCGYLARK